MKHKAVFILFIVGLCIIFLGSILARGAQPRQRAAEINSIYRDTSRGQTANELHMALGFTMLAHIFIALGAFLLVLASAIGAWTIEDKYVKLGMLIFCAIIAAFLLAPNIFTITI